MKIQIRIASEMAAEGKSASEIARAIGYSYCGAVHLLNQNKIPYSRQKKGRPASFLADREMKERVEKTDLKRRNEDIQCDFEAGVALEEIGKKHGITRERVRQIAAKMGFRPRHVIAREKTSESVEKLRAAAPFCLGMKEVASAIARAVDMVRHGASIRRARIQLGLSRSLDRVIGEECKRQGVESQHGRWRSTATVKKHQARVSVPQELRPKKKQAPQERKARAQVILNGEARSIREHCVLLRGKHTASEIATALGITRNAVIGHWFRARKLGAAQ